MTREDAINILCGIQADNLNLNDAYTKDKYDALDMAIKTLEQEPCEDAISRKRVMAEYCMREGVSKKSFVDIINELPSVTPQEPKTGHWEWVQYDYNPKLGDWYCSECRCVAVECVYKNEKAGIPLYKYCPQCGAKMVEPQESEGEE